MRLQQVAIKVSAMLCLVGLIVALAPSQASAGWRRRTVVYQTSEVVTPDGAVTTVYSAPATMVVPSTRVVYSAPVQEVFAAPTTTTVVSEPVRAVYTPTATVVTPTTTVVQSAVVPTTYVAPAPYVRRGLFRDRIVYPRSVYLVP